MVAATAAGVAFTADPRTSQVDRVVIEAAFGLGEVVVGGKVEPDTYVVAKDGPRLVSTRVGHQSHRLDGTPTGDVERRELSPEEGAARVLTDDEVLGLARLGLLVEARDELDGPQGVSH